MSGKRQKLPAKRSRPSEDPTPTFDASLFANTSAAERFGTICKNRSFIKEKGFHHPDDFFRKTIEAKGWRALCQPPRPATMSVVREFYANLASHVLKRVRVRGVLVDFSAESINSFYSLEHVPTGPFDQLREHSDYPEVIRVLTKGRGEWRINSAGHAVNFKAKHLAFIPKVWHHFITSRLIPTTNVCEVTAQRALLNFAIIQDIPFDVGQVIEDAILHNRDAKMNLGHLFLIFGLCKQAGVPLDDNEAWLHPIKAISVKRDTPGVPQPEGVYDSGHEPSDEDELPDYRARFGFLGDTQDDIGQSSSHLPPPPPQQPQAAAPPSPSPDLKDPVLSLTEWFDAFWDETQEHRVLVTQDMEALRADMRTVLANQAIILQQQQSMRAQLAQLLAFHHLHRSDLQGSSLTLYCFPLTSADTGYFVWGGGGCGDRVLCFCVLFIVVLVLVVCCLFSVFRILVVFCF